MPEILSNSELAQMRAAIGEHFPDTCHILSRTNTADGYGGVTATWGTLTDSVSCRADYINGREMNIGGQIRPFYGYIFSMPYNTTVTTEYRIKHGALSYSVVHVNDDQSRRLVKRAFAERV